MFILTPLFFLLQSWKVTSLQSRGIRWAKSTVLMPWLCPHQCLILAEKLKSREHWPKSLGRGKDCCQTPAPGTHRGLPAPRANYCSAAWNIWRSTSTTTPYHWWRCRWIGRQYRVRTPTLTSSTTCHSPSRSPSTSLSIVPPLQSRRRHVTTAPSAPPASPSNPTQTVTRKPSILRRSWCSVHTVWNTSETGQTCRGTCPLCTPKREGTRVLPVPRPLARRKIWPRTLRCAAKWGRCQGPYWEAPLGWKWLREGL